MICHCLVSCEVIAEETNHSDVALSGLVDQPQLSWLTKLLFSWRHSQNRYQTLHRGSELSSSYSSDCWMGEGAFISLENTTTCHKAYEKPSLYS